MASAGILGLLQPVIEDGIGLGGQRQAQRLGCVHRRRWRQIYQPAQQIDDVLPGRCSRFQGHFDGHHDCALIVMQHRGQDIDHVPVSARAVQQGLEALERLGEFARAGADAYGARFALQDRKPPAYVRDLRALLRRLEALEDDRQREVNRVKKAQIEGAPSSVIDSLQGMLATLAKAIKRLREQIDNHIDIFSDLGEQQAHVETIPGVGPKLSAWYRSSTSPAPVSSSVPDWARTATTAGGPGCFLSTLTAARYNADIPALYQRLIATGTSKMSAVGAAMRKVAHVAFGVFKHQRAYQPQSA